MVRASLVVSHALALTLTAACGKSEPPPPPAHTVAVDVGATIDPTLGQELRAAFVKHLSDRGFEVATLDAPAWSRVTLEIAAVRERDGALPKSGAFELTFSAHAKTGAGATHDHAERFFREAARDVDAGDWAAASAGEALAIDAESWLVGEPDLVALLERAGKVRRGVPTSLFATQALAAARADRMKAWDAYCEAEGARIAGLSSAVPASTDAPAGPAVQCVGDPCAAWSLIGPTADGRAAWVQIGRREPLFELAANPTTRWLERPVAIARVALEPGAKPVPAFRAGRLFGVPEAALDGSRIAAAHFGAGDLPVVTLFDATAPSKPGAAGLAVLRTLATPPSEQPGWALPIPGASAFVDAIDGVASLVAGDAEPALVGPSGAIERMWPGPRGVVVRLADGSIGRVDAHGLGPTMPFEGRVVALADTGAELLVVTRNGDEGCVLAHVADAPADAKQAHGLALVGETPLYECVRELASLADGRLVGLARIHGASDPGEDDEVVTVDPKSGRATPLTADGLVEELVRVSGQRVVFNRRVGEWPAETDLETYRREVCWLDVPAAR